MKPDPDKAQISGARLPLWRLLSGIAVLLCLLLVGAAIAPVYLANYRFARYVRALASQSDTASLQDNLLRDKVVEQAHRLNLPVQAEDVTVNRNGGRVQLQVSRYKAQVWHADLHFSAITTR